MLFNIEIVLRERAHAVTERIECASQPADWTDRDVEFILKEILLAIDRAKNPTASTRHVALRGFSWIVEPVAEGGVVIAVEIPMGAAIAGPFAVDQAALDQAIVRVLSPAAPAPTVIH